MLKVILADDEVLAREVYKVLIKRHFPGLQVVAEAETGRQAIELFEKFKSDLVFMDVKMPGINGIEAIDEISRKNPDTRFIIISAYNYFDYAKEAMKHGVEDYLLKPVSEDEFVNVVSKVLKKIEEKIKLNSEELAMREKLKSILPIIKEEAVFAIMMGDSSKMKQYISLLNMNISSGYTVIGRIKEENFENKDEIEIKLTMKKIQEFIKDNMPELKPSFISNFISRKIVFIFPLNLQEHVHNIKDIAFKRVVGIRNAVRDNFDIKMNFGISEVYNNLDEIGDSYNQALTVINNIDYFGMDIVNYGDIKCEVKKQFKYPYELENHLKEKIRLGLTEQSVSVFSKIFDCITESLKQDINRVKFELLELYFILSRMAAEADNEDTGVREFVMSKEKYFNAGTILELYHVFEEDIRLICRRFKEVRNMRAKNIIYDAVKYIRNYYMNDITLEEVAKKVCVSPNYFSRIFKNELNRSFIEYLTDTRVEFAKDLMHRTNKSIRDICWEVGYNDPNYFTKVFKKVTGFTPSEYKEKNQ